MIKKVLLTLLLIFITLPLSYAEVTDEDLYQNSLVYYNHDDNFVDGSTSIDSVGNYNGTINGATTGVTGQVNEAFDFDGSSDTIDVSNSLIANGEDVTISLWVNLDSIDGSGRNTFVSIGDELGFRLDSGNLNLGVAGETNGQSTISLDTNNWTQIAFVIDNSANQVTFYKNGANSQTDGIGEFSLNDNTLIIGNTPSTTRHIDGKMDEVWIKNELMNASEISEYYNRSSQDLEGSQYPFNSTTINETIPTNETTTGELNLSMDLENDFNKLFLIVLIFISLTLLMVGVLSGNTILVFIPSTLLFLTGFILMFSGFSVVYSIIMILGSFVGIFFGT